MIGGDENEHPGGDLEKTRQRRVSFCFSYCFAYDTMFIELFFIGLDTEYRY